MKKVLVVILIAFLASCGSKEGSNFNGCKYKVVNSLFSSNTEITIAGSYSPIDVYIIILDEIMGNSDGKGLKIHITDRNVKYISKEDVSYIKKYANRIVAGENMLSAINKASIVTGRITDFKE